jgi:hypothetical protein
MKERERCEATLKTESCRSAVISRPIISAAITTPGSMIIRDTSPARAGRTIRQLRRRLLETPMRKFEIWKCRGCGVEFELNFTEPGMHDESDCLALKLDEMRKELLAEVGKKIAAREERGAALDRLASCANQARIALRSENPNPHLHRIAMIAEGSSDAGVETHEPREWNCPQHGKFVSASNLCPSCAVENHAPKSECPRCDVDLDVFRKLGEVERRDTNDAELRAEVGKHYPVPSEGGRF